MLFDCRDERFENANHPRVVVDHPFRMELHADDVLSILGFDPFDDAVGRARDHAKAGCDLFERLMM
jgi:hypothetical protein